MSLLEVRVHGVNRPLGESIVGIIETASFSSSTSGREENNDLLREENSSPSTAESTSIYDSECGSLIGNIDIIIRNTSIPENINEPYFLISKRVYRTVARSATQTTFFTKLKSCETLKREWLHYSVGINGWKGENCFSEHGRSHEHRNDKVFCKVYFILHEQYLKQMLHRVISVIEFPMKLLAQTTAGTSFDLNLIAEFDPTLRTNLVTYGKLGK
ncbi:hypothetical protein PR048_023266 [Dryococelus australis]|uniref:Uncharacterized protein n=1 Tax=Dryococelus australis TaxID=614101 RepID=A0ABQ9GTJ6_9NEOP|nr:hypothetical protein PR048_023266 [Dryococelus australis]